MLIVMKSDAAAADIDNVIEVIERLGSVILLDCAVGPTMMVASVEPTVAARVHDNLRLAVNPYRVHFFDTETEAAI